MSRNAFAERAERARATLKRETGMDDLDYHLAILDGGCTYLERLVEPGPLNPQLKDLYRDHLTNLGFWEFYVYLFAHLEIGMVEDWSRSSAVELLQPAEWKRRRFLDRVAQLPDNTQAAVLLDVWLKGLGSALKMPITNEPKQAVQHV